MEERKKLLVADDHAIIREGLRALLSKASEIEIVGEAGDGHEAVRLAGTLRPDVILMDLCMPRIAGTEAIHDIKRRYPEIAIIVLTVHKTEEHIRAALDAGADGYMLKSDSGAELLAAIESVLRGKRYLSPSICAQIVHGYLDGCTRSSSTSSLSSLTHRERQVIKLIAEGYSNNEIAAQLTVSRKTVEKHRANLMQKLDLHNAPAVTAFAIENGLLA